MTPSPPKPAIRAILDGLYLAAGVLAALCLIGILIVIIMQMVARWSSLTFPGSSEYAGYLMASASFLAFADALNRGTHIRVNLFIQALGSRAFWGELWCLALGTAASAYLAWYAVKLVYWSRKLHDVSQGQDEMLLWIAQTPMAVGAVLLAIAFADNLATLLITGRDNIQPGLSDQTHGE